MRKRKRNLRVVYCLVDAKGKIIADDTAHNRTYFIRDVAPKRTARMHNECYYEKWRVHKYYLLKMPYDDGLMPEENESKE